MASSIKKRGLNKLAAPQRNNYFYGKLLDVPHFQMEQDYLNRKRWLVNRLGLGEGVLCGLNVTAKDGQVCISPGVAIDGLGHEIIVPETVSLDPWAVTDECGKPLDSKLENTKEHAVHICLSYHECVTDFQPVLVTECDTREQAMPGTIVESYRVLVREGELKPVKMDTKICEALTSPADSPDDRRRQLCEKLSDACATPNEKPCVILAKVPLLPKDAENPEAKIGNPEMCIYRRVVYSNRPRQSAFNFQLILDSRAYTAPLTTN